MVNVRRRDLRTEFIPADCAHFLNTTHLQITPVAFNRVGYARLRRVPLNLHRGRSGDRLCTRATGDPRQDNLAIKIIIFARRHPVRLYAVQTAGMRIAEEEEAGVSVEEAPGSPYRRKTSTSNPCTTSLTKWL